MSKKPAFNKVTVGFVIQTYDEDGKPLEQAFIAGDEVTYETLDGEDIEDIRWLCNEEYLPFDMVQP